MSADAEAEACVMATPVGRLCLRCAENSLVAVDWTVDEPVPAPAGVLREAERQLAGYFAGTLQRFDLPLAPAGSPHEHAVWNAMKAIPFGEVRTYGQIAAETGSSARAVGTACGRNPIPIIIPCHRIVAAGRRLGGYSGQGGGTTKRMLLALEGALCDDQRELFAAEGAAGAPVDAVGTAR